MDMYTGNVIETNLKFEVKNSKGKIIDPGSPCSGGEYLVTKFEGDPFLGTGISIGIDRLVFCLSQKEDIKAEEQKFQNFSKKKNMCIGKIKCRASDEDSTDC